MIDMAQFYNYTFLNEVEEGLSQRQIAKKLGISRDTVSNTLKKTEMPTTIQRQKVYSGTKQFSDETKRILPIDY